MAPNVTVVIGYGNALRGDDGIGPAVAERVAGWDLPGVRALAVPQLVPELAEVIAGASRVVFVDASLGPEGGSVQVEALRPADRLEALGHTGDPRTLLALAAAVFGRCSPAWIVHVGAERFAFGDGLSPAAERGIAAALGEVAHLIVPR
jgi:hydrogenase maturation protease